VNIRINSSYHHSPPDPERISAMWFNYIFHRLATSWTKKCIDEKSISCIIYHYEKIYLIERGYIGLIPPNSTTSAYSLNKDKFI
jgi:hypothetical protein